jgi:hypothetical protein
MVVVGWEPEVDVELGQTRRELPWTKGQRSDGAGNIVEDGDSWSGKEIFLGRAERLAEIFWRIDAQMSWELDRT